MFSEFPPDFIKDDLTYANHSNDYKSNGKVSYSIISSPQFKVPYTSQVDRVDVSLQSM